MMRRTIGSGPLVLTACAVLGGWTPTVCGAPVTFRFQAEVASVLNLGIDSPISPNVGDLLTVTYSFEPSNGLSNTHTYPQFLPLTVSFDGFALSASAYLIAIGNDRPEDVPRGGSIADPGGATMFLGDEGPSGYRDDYSITCGSPNPGSCGEVSGRPDLLWHLNVLLADDIALFSSSDLADDTAGINVASFREMRLTIFDPVPSNDESFGGIQSLQIGAYLGDLALVPEPSGAFLTISLLLLLGANHRFTLSCRLRMPFHHSQ